MSSLEAFLLFTTIGSLAITGMFMAIADRLEKKYSDLVAENSAFVRGEKDVVVHMPDGEHRYRLQRVMPSEVDHGE